MQRNNGKDEDQYKGHHYKESVKPTVLSRWSEKVEEQSVEGKANHITSKGNKQQCHIPVKQQIQARARREIRDRRIQRTDKRTTQNMIKLTRTAHHIPPICHSNYAQNPTRAQLAQGEIVQNQTWKLSLYSQTNTHVELLRKNTLVQIHVYGKWSLKLCIIV